MSLFMVLFCCEDGTMMVDDICSFGVELEVIGYFLEFRCMLFEKLIIEDTVSFFRTTIFGFHSSFIIKSRL